MRARAQLEQQDRKPWRQDRGCAREAWRRDARGRRGAGFLLLEQRRGAHGSPRLAARLLPVRWPAVTTLRAWFGILCGVLAAALGALILGEYEFRGSLPFVAGPLFGLVIGEIVVGVGRARSLVAGSIAAGAAFAGIVWAGWIDSSEGVEPVKALVWVAAPLAAAAAMLRIAGLPGRSR